MNKRRLAILIAAIAAAAAFVGLVCLVLAAAQVSKPSATTVRGLTSRRLWATASALLGLTGVICGGLALRRRVTLVGSGYGKRLAIAAVAAGLISVSNGALNLAVAKGGPGAGNGVVGAAAALVLGLIAMLLSALATTKSRRLERPSNSCG